MKASLVVVALLLTWGAMAVTPKSVVADNTGLQQHYLVNSTNATLAVQLDCSQTTDKKIPCFDGSAIALATGLFNDSHKDMGWDYVQIKANDIGEGSAYYYGGYLEGYLTSKSISYTQWTLGPNKATQDWLATHIKYIRKQAKTQDTAFWVQIANLISQLEGIVDGYNAKTNGDLTLEQLWIAQMGDEVGDVANAVSGDPQPCDGAEGGAGLHCSALIRITKDDMFMSHDTWSGYDSMVRRQFKVYDFNNVKVTLSAYPGTIASGDDWYMTSHELAIQETTNCVFNTTLFDWIREHPETVSEFLRVMGATYSATTGEEWSAFFATENSGTYNNQYMVVDFKLFTPGQALKDLPDGLLWVAEQIPEEVEKADVTKVLRETGYWASYNIPYFSHIYNKSGNLEWYEREGDMWSYTKYARPEIFHRNVTNGDVEDLAGMKRIMRYNNWKEDPLSLIPNCGYKGLAKNDCDVKRSPMLAIASRGDLNPESNMAKTTLMGPAKPWVNQHFGATDSKIASWSNRKSLTGYFICGPSYDQQTPFQFSKSWYWKDLQPKDSVDKYEFPWVEYNVVPIVLPGGSPASPTKKAGHETAIGIACGVGGAVLLALGLLWLRSDKRGPFRSSNAEEDPLVNAA